MLTFLSQQGVVFRSYKLRDLAREQEDVVAGALERLRQALGLKRYLEVTSGSPLRNRHERKLWGHYSRACNKYDRIAAQSRRHG